MTETGAHAHWRARVDPELAGVVDFLPDVDLSDVPEARRLLDELVSQAATTRPPTEDLEVVDHTIAELGDAPPVPVRVYRPTRGGSSLPGVLWIHGGGFVLGSVDAEDAGTAQLALALGAVVVAVDYRLAPENPFPAGLDDCYSALVWMEANAVDLGIDVGRIAVGGYSAGGGLAAAVALRARDQAGPSLCFQVLGIPELDDRLLTPSMQEFVDTPMWNRRLAEQSWRYYLGDDRSEVSPYAAPAREHHLRGLPPAYVCTAELDPLRDEGMTYAMRLAEAGVAVELHHFPGTFHGSQLVIGAEVSQRMVGELYETLRRVLQAKG